MNHIRNTVAAVVAAAALSLVAACGDLEPPATDIGKSVDKKQPGTQGPGPHQPQPDGLRGRQGHAAGEAEALERTTTRRGSTSGTHGRG